jgi:sugar lactone lactonase YvrE
MRPSFLLAALFSTSLFAQAVGDAVANARVVYANHHFEPTGVSAAPDGRLFVNYPRWSDRYLNAVIVQSPEGKQEPYPDLEWNRWDGKPQTAANHFVCVQSVVVDQANTLWVVDAAAPLLTSPVPNGPKLVRIDLLTNKVQQVFPMEQVTLADSYLNDIRIDNQRNFAYLTDSGHGGIIVVDIASGESWRKLDGHPSVLANPKIPVVVHGFELKQPNGKPAVFNADSIELSKDGETLYYKAINSDTLWSVPTALLRDRSADASSAVRAVATNLFPTDGLWMDSKNRLYLSDVEHNAVRRLSSSGRLELIFQSPALDWPDTFTEDASGNIYISASRLDEQPRYHDGYSVRHGRPYLIFRLDGLDPR